MQQDVLPGHTNIDRDYFASETAKCTLDDWRYEMRREIQEMLPGLYLGPLTACRDTEYLNSFGITHIVCLLDAMEAQLFRFLNLQSAFSFFPIQVSDSKTQNLIPLFPQITTFINDTLRRDGKILVCCNGGMSRSPAVVIAYMMETFNLDASEAYQYVQSRRLCINPNDAFKTQIAEYEPIYKARKNIATPIEEQRHRRRRRSDEGDDEEDGDTKRRVFEASHHGDGRIESIFSSVMLP
ncbi:hypothetical protein VTP01DRAFT_8997 [Rhizomucor pusillus]|uniref:uncharacterized protein n=1 Tax=Rhizomucor pusillus TaxID=4840 RepID=UPI0037444E9C